MEYDFTSKHERRLERSVWHKNTFSDSVRRNSVAVSGRQQLRSQGHRRCARARFLDICADYGCDAFWMIRVILFLKVASPATWI